MAKKRVKPNVQADAKAVKALQEQLVLRYGRLDNHGKVMHCSASVAEHADPDSLWRLQGNDGKPILRDKEAGEECARQLSIALSRSLYAYQCPRSKSGHYHVADGSNGRQRRR